MAKITSAAGTSMMLGSYSGITSKEIDKLIEAESVPLKKLNLQKSQITEQQNAWKDVNLRLNTLLTKIDSLQRNETFNSKITTSSDEDKVTLIAKDSSTESDYQITVEQLATSTKIISGNIDSIKDKTIYDGLNLKGHLILNDKNSHEVTVEITEKDSLKNISTKINSNTKKTGIKASLVDNHLVLSSVETGEKEINISGSLLSELGLNSGGMTYIKGKNAEFTIDGMKVTRSTNIVQDVLEDVTIYLKKETKDAVRLDVKNDSEKLVESVKELVNQYNTVMDFISEKLSIGDPSKKDNKPGTLAGDSALTRLQSSLRFAMTATPKLEDTMISKPKDVGITSKDKTSKIEFDEELFKKALEKNPEAVKKFFFSKGVTAGSSLDKVKTTEKGYTLKLKELMNTYIGEDKGKKSIYKTKSETLNQNTKDLDARIKNFEMKIFKKRDYYVRTFTRLDQVMMQAESQMAYLMSQMDSFSAG